MVNVIQYDIISRIFVASEVLLAKAWEYSLSKKKINKWRIDYKEGFKATRELLNPSLKKYIFRKSARFDAAYLT